MGSYIATCVRRGQGVLVGPGCVIGNIGFGYEKNSGNMWERRSHGFGVDIGDFVEIGANTVIDRGRWRDTVIGVGTKIDANCFLAHNVQIGTNCIIVAGTVIAGSCEIGNDVWIGPGVSFKDHVKVGDGAIIGVGSVVMKDVPAGEVWYGVPAEFRRHA